MPWPCWRGRLWTFHYATPNGNSPWFHPLRLPGGPSLTAFAPADHPWHHGLWFCWKYLNEVNYWEWAQTHDPATKKLRPTGTPAGLTRLKGKETVRTGAKGASIELDLTYGTTDTLVMTERRRIDIAAPRPDGSYTIDWRMTFTAAGADVVFDRTPPSPAGGGGYAGLSYRAPDSIAQVKVTDSAGREGMACRGPQSEWVDASGVIDPAFGPAGLTIFAHPSNPRFPSQWHIWAREGGVFTNASPVYGEPMTLKAGESFTWRYRVLMHKGNGDRQALARAYKAFAKRDK